MPFSPYSPSWPIVGRTALFTASKNFCDLLPVSQEDCMQSSSRQGNLYKISTSCPLVRSCNKKVKCLSFCGLTYLLPLKEEQKMKNVFQERKEKCRQKVKITLTDINGLTAYLISSRQMLLSSRSMHRIGDIAGQRRLGRAPLSHQHTTLE